MTNELVIPNDYQKHVIAIANRNISQQFWTLQIQEYRTVFQILKDACEKNPQ